MEVFKRVVDQEAFHTQWYSKAGNVVCGHEKSDKSDNECLTCGERYTENGSEWLNVPFVNNAFTKYVFTFKSNFNLVSDGNNVFFNSLLTGVMSLVLF